MRQISALMLQTTNAGVAHYRLSVWAVAAHRNKAFPALHLWHDKALSETHPWEVDITDPTYKHRLLAELDAHVKRADVVVCQMVHTRAALELLKAIKQAYKIPVVMEIDDQMLSTPTYNPASQVYGQGSMFRAVAIEQARMSDAMVVSTNYLKETYSEFCANIHVMPNSLDFRVWDNLKHRRNSDIVKIGWAGGASHSEDLKIVEPVVKRILAAYPKVQFCFVHGIPDFFRGIERVESYAQWTRIDRYPQMLASRAFDIGIAPLVDNGFNRGKSNLRWLEYAGLKIPCIASRVGHFAETLTHLEDAVLCDSEQEWFDALSWLIEDEVARKKIGKNANATARKTFNVDRNVFNYRDSLAQIVDAGIVVPIPDLQEAV